MADPLVSVVVSTRNRPASLARLLASLRRQELAAEQFEVIVVDDGSDPPVPAELRRSGDVVVRAFRHQAPRGPAAGRNTGWREARAPLVAFTDDDCVAEPGWLAAAHAVAQQRPGAILQGVTRPDPAGASNNRLLSRTVQIERLGPQFQTCNVFYPRALLESLGGFDENFGANDPGEDTDLAWRGIEHGAEAVLVPDAIVLHAVEWLGMSGALRQAIRWGGAMRLFAVHPQLRSKILYRSLFWNVWHYLLWRSLLALLGPRWLRRLLLTQHLLELHKRARDAGAAGSDVPFLLVHDAVECWAIARGAIRERTLVL